MHPRLASSIKWTALPKELSDQIKSIFTEAFSAQLADARLIVDGRIYPEELLLRVGHIKGKSIRQINFEVSLGFDPKKQNALKEIHFAIDCAASMMDEYFRAESLSEFPLHWQKFDAQNKDAYIQVSTVNTDLEAQADALLGELDDSLVRNSDFEDDEDSDGSETKH